MTATGGADVATVPPGHIIRYGYVRFRDVDLQDFGGMYPEALLRWLARYRDIGDSRHQFVDCPFGRWDGDRFVIENGRHRFFAAIFQGYESVLVRWLESAP